MLGPRASVLSKVGIARRICQGVPLMPLSLPISASLYLFRVLKGNVPSEVTQQVAQPKKKLKSNDRSSTMQAGQVRRSSVRTFVDVNTACIFSVQWALLICGLRIMDLGICGYRARFQASTANCPPVPPAELAITSVTWFAPYLNMVQLKLSVSHSVYTLHRGCSE